jgi:hypothetical protein
VLRLLVVYFATVAAALFLAHRFVSPVRARVGILLALGPFLLVGKALLTAGVHAPIDIAYQGPPLSSLAARMGTEKTKTPILSDVALQEIPWRKAVREAVKSGRLPLWNRFVLGGEPLLAVQQHAFFHPATWIGFLLPLAQAWTFEMALRYFLALLCAYLFLRDLACGEVAALLGAVGWAFCDYLVFFLGYPLTPAAAPFPLLLLGLRRLVSGGDRRAVGLTVVALLLNLTSGHPESLLHAVAGGAIYFLFELAFAGKGRRLRPVLLSLLAGALTLGLSAVLLLPLAEALPHTQEQHFRSAVYARSRKSFPLWESLRHASLNVIPYGYGVSGYGEAIDGFAEPSSYAGSLLWPLALVGLLSARREKWAFLALGVLGIGVGASFPGITDALSALPLFNIAINSRMAFLASFALAALAALGLQRLLEEGGSRLFAAGALVSALVVGGLCFQARARLAERPMPPEYFINRTLLQVVPLALGAAVGLVGSRRGRGFGLLGGGTLLLLLVAQRGLEERDYYPTYPSRAFYPPLRLFDAIPKAAPDRMTALGFTFIPNIAALYEVEDVRGYEAMTFKPLFETFPVWCVAQPVWYNRVDDPTKPFLSFLNVRYVMASPDHLPPEGWRTLYKGDEGQLFENPRVLPRAFVPRLLRYEPDGVWQVALLRGIHDFADEGIIGEDRPAGASGNEARANGEARVRIAFYGPQRMTLEVNARQPAFVATSMTAWPGWKLTVDGARTPLVPYNHAFLGFRVPSGLHTAVLRYMPDSFVAGAVISLVSLAAGLYLLLRGRRPGSSRVPA